MDYFGCTREARLSTFRPLPNDIAIHDTFDLLFQALDPAAFAETFAHWTQGLRNHLGREIVALDGKAARRAVETGQRAPLGERQGQSMVA